MHITIRACPFCGGDPEEVKLLNLWMIECKNCMKASELVPTIEEAREHWNMWCIKKMKKKMKER